MLTVSLLLQTALVPVSKRLLAKRKQQQFVREKTGCKTRSLTEDSVSTSKVVCVRGSLCASSLLRVPEQTFQLLVPSGPLPEPCTGDAEGTWIPEKKAHHRLLPSLKSNWIFTFTS